MMNGKKPRRRNPRTRASADALCSEIIEKMYNEGFFSSDGQLIAPVIEEWVLRNCTNYKCFRDKSGKLIRQGADKFTTHTLDAILKTPVGQRFSDLAIEKPKRWYDTTKMFHRYMYLDCLRCEGIPHRQLTFWVGQDLLQEARTLGKPLAAWLLKRIREQLKRLLDDTEFGLWFHLEHKPGEPDKIHAHGLLYIVDEAWLMSGSVKYGQVREAIREATGFEKGLCDGDMAKERWVFTPDKELNHGNQIYSSKSRRGRLFKLPYMGEPDLALGTQIECTTQSLRKRAQTFYERARPLVTAFIDGSILEWSDERWNELGVTQERDLLI
ncbi:hypothetical protein [Hyphomonas sp.]|uniref:hypothetical protein n=1 Tax=Hyphomonas sp. TaxID=87 RepID=UPI0025BAE3C6|nr:hypothetical protein [Hyphomonas sp.]